MQLEDLPAAPDEMDRRATVGRTIVEIGELVRGTEPFGGDQVALDTNQPVGKRVGGLRVFLDL